MPQGDFEELDGYSEDCGVLDFLDIERLREEICLN